MGCRPSAHKRGYGARWRRARKAFLKQYPLCAMCQLRGMLTPATVVDHIVPHKGDASLFWDKDNLQSLCKTCHDSHKQSQEKRKSSGCDESGLPLDPDHHWNT